jgi:hypothetical protein
MITIFIMFLAITSLLQDIPHNCHTNYIDNFNTTPEPDTFSTNGNRKRTGRIFLALIQHTVLKWCNNYFLHLLLSHSMLHPSCKKFPQNKISNQNGSGIGSGCWWEGPIEIKSA